MGRRPYHFWYTEGVAGVAPYEIVQRHLARYLGPHTARTAIKTFADKSVGKLPEEVTRGDVPALLAALRPMLRTLIGGDECESVLHDIARELTP